MQVEGKLLELANHHTASRVIQFCAKYGTPQQRAQITEQVGGKCESLSAQHRTDGVCVCA